MRNNDNEETWFELFFPKKRKAPFFLLFHEIFPNFFLGEFVSSCILMTMEEERDDVSFCYENDMAFPAHECIIMMTDGCADINQILNFHNFPVFPSIILNTCGSLHVMQRYSYVDTVQYFLLHLVLSIRLFSASLLF